MANKSLELRDQVNRAIDRELARCRRKMGDDAWKLHADWVREHVVAGAKEWLRTQAVRGAL